MTTADMDEVVDEPPDETRSPQWGAALVEPAPIAALRQTAAHLLAPLGNIAPPRSGIPSRAVRYFTLTEETSDDLLRTHGLQTQADSRRRALVRDGQGVLHVVERESLLPLVRRPSDVGGVVRVPSSAYEGSYLFNVPKTREELEALRRTHTLDYIRYGERTEFAAPTGSRRAGGVPSQRAQTAVRAQWWTVPSMPTRGTRVLLPKGRGVHCAPELPEGVVTLDNYFYAAPVEGLANARALAAVLNLSWTHLMAEIFGRRNAGAGVLQTYIRELARLPVPNPAAMRERQIDHLLEKFEAIATRQQRDVHHELNEPSRQAFDLAGMEVLFGPDAEAASAAVSRALRDLATEREAKAASGQQQIRRAAVRQSFDARRVAARLADELPAPPTPLEDRPLAAGQLGTEIIHLANHEPVVAVHVQVTLFGATLHINGKANPHLELPEAGHVRFVAACLTAARKLSGQVAVPADPKAADEAAWQWLDRWTAWQEALASKLLELLPGGNRAQQRHRVSTEVAELFEAALEIQMT